MICARCGATMFDRITHLAWHAGQEDLEDRLAALQAPHDAVSTEPGPTATRER